MVFSFSWRAKWLHQLLPCCSTLSIPNSVSLMALLDTLDKPKVRYSLAAVLGVSVLIAAYLGHRKHSERFAAAQAEATKLN